MNINENIENIVAPKYQLKLFGYEKYFNTFIKMADKNVLPNTILLSGPKGLGKSTFVYHFVNYLLSKNEKNKYTLENFSINPDNKSYKNICNFTHPNFFLVERKDSLSYIEFIRGKYKNPLNHDYIQLLISRMTKEEKKKLLLNDFDTLWKELWIHVDSVNQRIQKEYKKSKVIFDQQKKGNIPKNKVTY